jgi:hypothetical protein
MRFNNRACALMDIPDLPQGAFEHIGDRKIKPQGGGGGDIISSITDPISDVLGTSGGGGGILGAVEDVGQAVGDVGASFEKEVIDPLGGYKVVAPIAAAIAAPYLLPELAALAGGAEGAAAFTGATETGLATLAGEGALADTIGATLLAGAPEAAITAAEIGTALPYTEAFDAVNQATRLGLGEADITRNLTMTGMDNMVAQDMARLATQGLSPDQIVQTLSYSYTPAELAGTGIESKALGLPSKGLSAMQALQGARMASGLLGQRQPMPQLRQPQLQIAQTRPSGAVDYSGLLNLLNPRIATRNPNSLLG